MKRQQLESLLKRIQEAQKKIFRLFPASKSTDVTTTKPQKADLMSLSQLPGLEKSHKKLHSTLNIDDDLDKILNSTNDIEDPMEDDVHSDDIATTTTTATAKSNRNEDELDVIFNSTEDDIQKLLGSSLNNKITNIKSTKGSSLTKEPLPPIRSLPPIQSTAITRPTETQMTKTKLDPVNISAIKDSSKTTENDDQSLSKEILSELSDGDDTSEGDDEPLMSSGHLKGLENLKLVTSDEDEIEDYNKLAETDYHKRKIKMEEEFEKKKIKPDDPGFVYDKQVDFEGTKIESNWDDSLSDHSSEF
jgi:hypothetical protein